MKTSRIKIHFKSKIHTSRIEMMVLSMQVIYGQIQFEVDNALPIPKPKELHNHCSFIDIKQGLTTSIITIVLGDNSKLQVTDDYTNNAKT